MFIQEAIKKIPELEIKDNDEQKDCITCIQGKMRRRKFPTGKAVRTKEALEVVHTDIVGKNTPASLDDKDENEEVEENNDNGKEVDENNEEKRINYAEENEAEILNPGEGEEVEFRMSARERKKTTCHYCNLVHCKQEDI
ncbi:hypothetical protein QE152_g40099 [Popillia japonica]|uniref:Uncharacterized protein n=1 Tax=Popillia japonica TaxID=7064 RepID=A0AAW1HS83_POPJA